MALTESYMLPLGNQAPKFKLLDVIENKDKSLQELKGEKGTLIVFMCNHCPYVVHLMNAIVETASIFSKQGVKTIVTKQPKLCGSCPFPTTIPILI